MTQYTPQYFIDKFEAIPEENWCISSVNDGLDERYQQPTPKQRILAALRDIQKEQEAK